MKAMLHSFFRSLSPMKLAFSIALLLTCSALHAQQAELPTPQSATAPVAATSEPAALPSNLEALESAYLNTPSDQMSLDELATLDVMNDLGELDALTATEQPVVDSEEPIIHDLSPWGMYQAADVVVKTVMILLVLASILTWTIWLAKSFEVIQAKRRLRAELGKFKGAHTLQSASKQMKAKSLSAHLINEAEEELQLSSNLAEKDNIKERVSLRLDRLVAGKTRRMNQGTGILATIGSISPFVGLFGTVWGIMNSFIGIAQSQTTNLAVVAPGIAEALLATALGLVAAIPAVIIYNMFVRSIGAYTAQAMDASAQVLILVSRDLDQEQAPASAPSKPRVAEVV